MWDVGFLGSDMVWRCKLGFGNSGNFVRVLGFWGCGGRMSVNERGKGNEMREI